MSKVFVTQEMERLNYLPAEKFGEITFITRNEFSPVKTSLNNAELMDQIWKSLSDFNESEDYLVFSGSPTVAAAVFAVVGFMLGSDGKEGNKNFRVLRWSNRDNEYTPITINIE